VLASRPDHVADQPLSLASTDFKLRIPCYCLLENLHVKETRERLQRGVGWPGGLASRPPPGPLVSGLCTLSPRVRCIPVATLILVEFQFFL
jgi:hypothetical protein